MKQEESVEWVVGHSLRARVAYIKIEKEDQHESDDLRRRKQTVRLENQSWSQTFKVL